MTSRSDDVSVFDILDSHLRRLDGIAASPQVVFASGEAKQRYETLLTYSSRKYRAAGYHLANVREFIATEARSLEPSSTAENLSRRHTRAEFRFARTADEYVYELAAFLGAMKSAVDLLAGVCSFYLPGISTNYSIRPLLRLAGRGRTGSVFDVIANNSAWLIALRSYRDQLVHRLMPSVRSGYIIRTMGGHVARVRVPVVVPDSTPCYVPDTRETRMLDGTADRDGGLLGLEIETIEGRVSRDDGTTEIVEFSVSLEPSLGFSAIDDFMSSHLDSFGQFFAQLIETFDKLQFRPAPRDSGRGA